MLLANMGVPMIAAYWPPAWLALVPVVVVEAWWARRVLGVSYAAALRATLVANLVTTFVAIPVLWYLWVVIESCFFGGALGVDTIWGGLYAVTVQAGWVLPYERHLWWMLPAASLALTVVFFFASVTIEWPIVRAMLRRQATRPDFGRWAWRAHLMSYAIVLTFVVAFLYLPRASLDYVARGPVDWVVDRAWYTARWWHGIDR